MTDPNPPATLEEISDRLAAIERLLRQLVYPPLEASEVKYIVRERYSLQRFQNTEPL